MATEPELLSAFQYVTTVTTPAIVVPTTVRLPLPDSLEVYEGRQFLVVEEEQGSLVGAQLITASNVLDPVVSASTEPHNSVSPWLIDNDFSTAVDFIVTGEQANEFTVMLESDGETPITATRLKIDLAPHVSLPLTVSVQASVDRAWQTVLSRTQMTDDTVNFPETTAHRWRATFRYIQPLRIAEISLEPDMLPTERTNELRFLAQPGQTYNIYSNPDQTVVLPRVESGNLRDSEEMVFAEVLARTENPLYVPADVDDDGIIDRLDNCVSYPNPEQIDVNQNGKGDVCEDFDRDSLINALDNCPNIPNRNQADEDGDSIGDACDEEESRLTERYVWVPWVGMGVAAIVILSLFMLVGKRPEEDVEQQTEEAEVE
jgi:hypothetical protein